MRPNKKRIDALLAALDERVLVLDGAMGSLIQGEGLAEADYRGERFANHSLDLLNNNDILSLTRPDLIARLHRRYVDAGADIIETNTFGANAVSQEDFDLAPLCREMNEASARLARQAVDEAAAADGRVRWVAGAMGPTPRTASISPDVSDPSVRNITYDALRDAYADAARGLLDGGVDLLLVETIFDTLNGKAALHAALDVLDERGLTQADVPLWVSGTITDKSGRTLSGQTTEAFVASVMHAKPLIVGLNCALGAKELLPFIEELSRVAPVYVAAYPNAGLPNEFGGYDESPADLAAVLGDLCDRQRLNAVGGCCGTTPEHIGAIVDVVGGAAPRRRPELEPALRLSGLEPFTVFRDSLFVNIGERTNVSGSARFARLIRDGDFDAALSVARQQVQAGAQMVDVNMDDGLIDAEAAMTRFLNMIAGEPDIARVPIVIDSSKWSVIEAGLKCVQGRAIVNSISLKDGEASFREQARAIQRYGASVIVMAFDEQGQADTVPRRVDILRRSVEILVQDLGYAPHDIVLDPNVFAIATGIEEHDRYALDFIEGCRAVAEACPGVWFSGGISNVSFSFRGNRGLREAIHAVFLEHAIRAGLTMGIVNAGALPVVGELPDRVRERIEDAVLARRTDAAERLLEVAQDVQGVKAARADDGWRELAVRERIVHALVHGIADHAEADAEEAMAALGSAYAVIDGPLMDGMDRVGELFGDGQMFLPQVVKSARVMKRAVGWLTPHLEAASDGAPSRGKVLLATVKGDVHDIGKNIVGVVLRCNGFDIRDLGVMVPAHDLLQAADEWQPDVIGLSGLITPSLDEMTHVAKEMARLGRSTPLMIGGATTSRAHTAMKIEPHYDRGVVHVADASRAVAVASALASKDTRADTIAERAREYADVRVRRENAQAARTLRSLADARARRAALPVVNRPPVRPGLHTIALDDVSCVIDRIDWSPFFHAWELRGTYPRILDDSRFGEQATSLFDDARRLLDRWLLDKTMRVQGVVGLFPANAVGDDIDVFSDTDRQTRLARFFTLRQQHAHRDVCLALSDFLRPPDAGIDWIGGFAVTAGHGVAELVAECEAANDDYGAILVKTLADRLAEASAEWLHEHVRRELWGYAPDEAFSTAELIKERYEGIRPAPGYPAQPDHSEKHTLWKLLEVEQRAGIDLTDSGAMWPAASVSGLYFAHPEARYFGVGKVGQDQLADYAVRKGWTEAEAAKWLGPSLA